MISQAPDVETYIEQAPAERRAVLQKLRKLSREVFKHAEESISYGMPAYKQGETLLFAFASQKQYIALYAGKAALDEHRAELKGAQFGKGCAKFSKPEVIDFGVIRKVLLATAKSRGSCA